MDILLVNPDSQRVNNFPLGILAIGSYLKKFTNYSVELLDQSVFIDSQAFTESLIEQCKKTSLVGISFMTTQAYLARDIIQTIKKYNPQCKIITGGPHSILYPEQTIRYQDIDFVAYGEGEKTVAKLLEVLSEENRYTEVLGLVYKNNGKIVKNPPASLLESEEMPNICYELLDKKVIDSMRDYIEVITSRGCSYHCTFCINSICSLKWRGKNVDQIIDELDNIVTKYNPRTISFQDQDFFQSKERTYRLIEKLIDRKFYFQWQAAVRANYFSPSYINNEMIPKLKKSGCICLQVGAESGSQRILNKLKKGIKIEQIFTMAKDCKEANIECVFSFIIGFPHEKKYDYYLTLKCIDQLFKMLPNCTIIGPQPLRIYPGGELYEEIKQLGYQEPKSFEEWTQRNLKQKFSDYPFQVENHHWTEDSDFINYLQVFVHLVSSKFLPRQKLKRLMILPFRIIAKLRWRLSFFNYPYDAKFYNFMLGVVRKIKK
ncbi:MAG: B12-binding domain-containing radical SAM protein [Candidatus Omnitrophica bacterium]|nr:B12-binding domain-containing radical SAM protein [Candidatus Omnitrophota bacterium]MBU1047719.1 B12-binding domain-containing radical SAM protein [Candidatus Omnitrophota bacterium]MBU1767007.1 B12-binding domain-containing radical SAM protein [Candidatus Omnitrophota bacterium]MBU1888551.1 B12-binding domain-containing radical SAM protein [Candidatus Omnitrophota bacterium]